MCIIFCRLGPSCIALDLRRVVCPTHRPSVRPSACPSLTQSHLNSHLIYEHFVLDVSAVVFTHIFVCISCEYQRKNSQLVFTSNAHETHMHTCIRKYKSERMRPANKLKFFNAKYKTKCAQI